MSAVKILNDLLTEYKSIREFARAISEDPADVFRWKADKRAIHPRAVISIVKLHPKIKAHDLNPDVFEKGITFNFIEGK